MKPNLSYRLFAITAIASGILTACGGGGGSSTPSTITGAVIDGYLKGAVVCLDINANLKCDGDSEYQTTSGDNGAYTLKLGSGVDVTKYHVLAEVGTDAIDSDTNAAPANAYTLLAPAADAAVVTPLTTFVSNTLITNSTLTIDEAKTQTLAALNLPATTKLNQDYVAAKDTETHHVAIVAAAVLGQVKTDVVTAVAPTTDAQKMEAIKYTMKQAQNTVATYSQAAAATTSGLTAIKEAATTAAKQQVADNTTLKDNVQKQAELGTAKVVSVADLLKTGNMYDIRLSNYSNWDATTNTQVLKEGLEYERVSSADGTKVTFENYFSPKADPAWVLNGGWYSSSHTEYSASEGNKTWVDTTIESSGTWAPAGDGTTGTFTSDKTGQTIKISMAVLDVGGKKASLVPYLLSNAGAYCGWDSATQKNKVCADWSDFTFSTGAQIINSTFYRNQDEYRVNDCDGCGAFAKSSYDSVTQKTIYTYPVKTLDEVIAKSSATGSTDMLWLGGGVPAVLTKVSDTAGTVAFLEWNNTTQKYDKKIGEGAYVIATVVGKKVMTIKVTSESTPGKLIANTENGDSGYVHTVNGRAILVEWDNKVLFGTMRLKGLFSSSDRPFVNRIAADDLLKAQGYTATK